MDCGWGSGVVAFYIFYFIMMFGLAPFSVVVAAEKHEPVKLNHCYKVM